MGKRDKNKSSEAPNEEGTVAVEVVATEQVDLKSLFVVYHERDAALTAAKNELELCGQARSDAVKAIMDAGKGKRNFRINGLVQTIVARTTKDKSQPEGGEKTTYFFKGQREEDVVEID